jgi:hypothetical protein
MDPISTIGGGIGIAQGVLQFLGYVRGVASSAVVSALFTWDGTRIHGDEIEVERHMDAADPAVWWYSVMDRDGYVFVRIPVVQSCAHELVGTVAGEKNPDHRYWRWVAQERQGVIVGGGSSPPSLKVDFIVVGYKPKALVEHFAKK